MKHHAPCYHAHSYRRNGRRVVAILCFLFFFFFFNDTATSEIYTLSLHDALPIWLVVVARANELELAASIVRAHAPDLVARSEEHTSELQSRGIISYAVFCLKKKINDFTLPLSNMQLHVSMIQHIRDAR